MRTTWVSRLAGVSLFALGAQLPVSGQSTPEVGVTLFHDRPLEARLEVKLKNAPSPRVLEWTFGDGSAPSREAAPLHAFPRLAQFPVRARIVSSSGVQSTIERVVNLATPPYIEITGASPVETSGGNALRFTAEVHAGSRPPDPSTWVWDFGDGTSARGGSVTHLYPRAGTFLVSVRANKNPTTALVDRVEVKVTIPGSEPAPLPPPPPPPPPPRLTLTTSFDFESSQPTLDGSVLCRITDPARAHAGTGSMEVNLTLSAQFHAAISGAFGGALLPFFLADRIDARWWCRWEAPLTLDASRIQATLDEYLAAGGTGLTTTQAQRVRTLTAAAAGQLGTGFTLEGQRWYCVTIRYVFPVTGGTPGSLALAVDGRTLVSLEGISILDDGAILEALVKVVLTGKAVTSSATRCWVDDLLLTTQGASCQ